MVNWRAQAGQMVGWPARSEVADNFCAQYTQKNLVRRGAASGSAFRIFTDRVGGTGTSMVLPHDAQDTSLCAASPRHRWRCPQYGQ